MGSVSPTPPTPHFRSSVPLIRSICHLHEIVVYLEEEGHGQDREDHGQNPVVLIITIVYFFLLQFFETDLSNSISTLNRVSGVS